MSVPPGWWTCRTCRAWNSPYVAPDRCGGCQGYRGESSYSPGSSGNSHPAVIQKIKFGEASGRTPPSFRHPRIIGQGAPQIPVRKEQFIQATFPRTTSSLPNSRRNSFVQKKSKLLIAREDLTITPITSNNSAVSSPTLYEGTADPKTPLFISEVAPKLPISPALVDSQSESLQIGSRRQDTAEPEQERTVVVSRETKPAATGQKLEGQAQVGFILSTAADGERKTLPAKLDGSIESGQRAEWQGILSSISPPPACRSTKRRHGRPSSSSSSDASVDDNLFSSPPSVSSTASGSSQFTAADSQWHTEQFARFIYEDDILQHHLFAAVDVITRERLEKRLRKYLRLFGEDLSKEAEDTPENNTARFIKRRARNAAHLICDELKLANAIMKEKQTRPFEESDESDPSGDEAEADDIQDSGAFILRSRALKGLRMKLGKFVQREMNSFREIEELRSKNLLGVLPFADSDGDSDFTTNNLRPLSTDTSISIWRSITKIKNKLLHEPRLEKGMKRVRWKCACGASIHDDYKELEHGAVNRLQRLFNRSFPASRLTKTASKRYQITPKTIPILGSMQRLVPSFMATQDKGDSASLPRYHTGSSTPALPRLETVLGSVPPSDPRYETGPSTTNPVSLTIKDGRFLLLSINNSKAPSHKQLEQPAVHQIQSDKELFALLRETYNSLRHRWWSFLSLKSLEEINFVHLEIYDNGHISPRKWGTVPPSYDYEYQPCPHDPPVGSNTLRHFMRCPMEASFLKICFNRIPKKKLEPLTVLVEDGISSGWGLDFVEGWQWGIILISSVLLVFSTTFVTFACFRFTEKSIQDSVALTMLVISPFVFGMAALQAYLHMN